MELTKYYKSGNKLKEATNALYNNVFPSTLYGPISSETLIGHENSNLRGFIELANSRFSDYFSVFIGITMSKEFIRNPLPELNKSINDDLYISRMAVKEEYRGLDYGSNILNQALHELKLEIKINKVWTLVTDDNPSDRFWLKNGFDFKLRFTAPDVIKNSYFPPANLYCRYMN